MLSDFTPLRSNRIFKLHYQNKPIEAFLNWLQPKNPELAAKLHDANHGWPYTVSALQGPFERENGGNALIGRGRSVYFPGFGVAING